MSTNLDRYQQAGTPVSMQRCAFGDDQRGYCGIFATVHIACAVPDLDDGGHTMSCAEHEHLVHHPVRDRHPINGVCGLPGAEWIDSHPTGGPGWCQLDEPDWLSAVSAEPSDVAEEDATHA